MSAPSERVGALRAELEAETRARIEQIRRAGLARVERLRAEGEQAAGRRRAAALEAPAQEVRSEAARALARARADALRTVLEARDAILEQIFERARAELETMPVRPVLLERLVGWARGALERLPPGDAVIICSPALAAPLESALGDLERVRVETRSDAPAGFRILAADGALEIDGTLASLLDVARPELSVELLRRIEEDAA